ncbi:GvpL/GvpF family gas vesicle protein [Kitasatospora sp. NPDC006697]|uniref:GvpL/GvpF family gas vesicle protein n=1 Tax=Kitasatospora sp. NPDC006697 TaxID=3364020 RepID=UPI00369FF43B
MNADRLSYVYAVVRGPPGPAGGLDAVRGVLGAPVHTVPTGSDLEADADAALLAVVSPVPADEFRETALREHLEDLGWLEALARAHDGVIEALAAHGTVLPLRLATVYLDEDRILAMLGERKALLLGRLGELDGRVELGVKLYVDTAPGAPAPAAPDPALGPGRAYLHRRRGEQHAREDAHRAAERAAERIAAAARAQAVERARHRVQQGELAAGPGQNVSNDAYLVPAEQAGAFRADLLRCTDGLTGVRVEVTGPWAPYSFAGLPEPDGPP